MKQTKQILILSLFVMGVLAQPASLWAGDVDDFFSTDPASTGVDSAAPKPKTEKEKEAEAEAAKKPKTDGSDDTETEEDKDKDKEEKEGESEDGPPKEDSEEEEGSGEEDSSPVQGEGGLSSGTPETIEGNPTPTVPEALTPGNGGFVDPNADPRNGFNPSRGRNRDQNANQNQDQAPPEEGQGKGKGGGGSPPPSSPPSSPPSGGGGGQPGPRAQIPEFKPSEMPEIPGAPDNSQLWAALGQTQNNDIGPLMQAFAAMNEQAQAMRDGLTASTQQFQQNVVQLIQSSYASQQQVMASLSNFQANFAQQQAAYQTSSIPTQNGLVSMSPFARGGNSLTGMNLSGGRGGVFGVKRSSGVLASQNRSLASSSANTRFGVRAVKTTKRALRPAVDRRLPLLKPVRVLKSRVH